MTDIPTFDIEEIFPPDRMQAMFDAQRKLQVNTFGFDSFEDMPTAARVDYFAHMVLAATDELHEALNETSWKSWAKAEYFNDEKVKSELVDVFHFFMNLCIVAGLTPDELFKSYREKREINVQRQKNGYDGVSTKCVQCKRALDDPAVGCFRDDTNMAWCETHNQSYRIT